MRAGIKGLLPPLVLVLNQSWHKKLVFVGWTDAEVDRMKARDQLGCHLSVDNSDDAAGCGVLFVPLQKGRLVTQSLTRGISLREAGEVESLRARSMYQIFEGACSGSQDQLCVLQPSKDCYPCLGYSLRGDWYAEDEEDSSGEDEDAEDEDRGLEEEEETGDDDD
ncbi:hypothetical protein BJ165DRAFT_1598260 [Panaeolus papilionaceus]|nr:hypothetical protein BJ165DRAFT_1598260 [Panaeolus papilionaceus]